MPNVNKELFEDTTLCSYKNATYRYPGDGSTIEDVLGSHVSTRKRHYAWLYRFGTTTSNYAVKKALGKLPCNPFEYRFNDTYWVKGLVEYENTWPGSSLTRQRITFEGCGVGGFEVADSYLMYTCLEPEDRTDVVREARKRALDDLGNQKINVAQFIAERKQTISLIAESAMKIAGFILALKKGNIVEAGKALGSRPSRSVRRGYRKLYAQSPNDAVSDAWLQLQYGVKPLLMDVYGAVDVLSEATSDYQRFMSKSKAVRSRSNTREFPPWSEGTFRLIMNSKVVCKHTYMFDVRQSLSNTVASLGLTNPANLAWELLPYSFVADWFLPVGNYLQSLDATVGLAFNTGSEVIYEKHTTTLSWTPNPSRTIATWQGEVTYRARGYATGKRTTVSVTRTVLNDFPKPEFPSFKNPFSVTHAANALALLNNAVKSRKR